MIGKSKVLSQLAVVALALTACSPFGKNSRTDESEGSTPADQVQDQLDALSDSQGACPPIPVTGTKLFALADNCEARPSEENEGVYGYLANPDLINTEIKGTGSSQRISLSGPAGAIHASISTDPVERVRVHLIKAKISDIQKSLDSSENGQIPGQWLAMATVLGNGAFGLNGPFALNADQGLVLAIGPIPLPDVLTDQVTITVRHYVHPSPNTSTAYSLKPPSSSWRSAEKPARPAAATHPRVVPEPVMGFDAAFLAGAGTPNSGSISLVTANTWGAKTGPTNATISNYAAPIDIRWRGDGSLSSAVDQGPYRLEFGDTSFRLSLQAITLNTLSIWFKPKMGGYLFYLNDATYGRYGNTSSPFMNIQYGGMEFQVMTDVGNWNHLVMTDDGSRMSIYLNGVLADSALASPPSAALLAAQRLYVGSTDGGDSFRGSIAEFRLYDRGLEDVDVLDLYYSGASRFNAVAAGHAPVLERVGHGMGPMAGGNEVDLYGWNLAGAAVKIDGVAVTTTYVENSSHLAVVVPAGTRLGLLDISVSKGSDVSTLPRAYYRTATRLADRILHLDAQNVDGNGAHGSGQTGFANYWRDLSKATVSGTRMMTVPDLGGGPGTNGAGTWNNPYRASLAGDFFLGHLAPKTISLWFKTTANTADGPILYGSANTQLVNLVNGGYGSLRLSYNTASEKTIYGLSNPSPVWNHVAMTNDGTTTIYYWNGVPIQNESKATLSALDYYLNYGSYGGSNVVSQCDFATVRMYSEPLRRGEIQQIYFEEGDRFRIPAAVVGIRLVENGTGPTAGGKEFTVRGWNFESVTEVRINDVPATNLKVKSSYELTAIAPPGASGLRDVKLLGSTIAIQTKAYQYNDVPTEGALACFDGYNSDGNMRHSAAVDLPFWQNTLTADVDAMDLDFLFETPGPWVSTGAPTNLGALSFVGYSPTSPRIKDRHSRSYQSVSLWFKPISFSQQYLLDHGAMAHVSLNNDSPHGSGLRVQWGHAVEAIPIPDYNWHHFALSYDPATNKVAYFLDGNPAGVVASIGVEAGVTYWGSDNLHTASYLGDLGHMCLYNRPLTSGDLVKLQTWPRP